MLRENAIIRRLKSKLTNEELHLINKDINRMNKYGASDLMRNVFEEAAETRAKTYLNRRQKDLGNSEQNGEEQPQGQDEEQSVPEKPKEKYITSKEKVLRGRLIQKGIKPTRSGELKFPNGRKYNVSYYDFIHDFRKDFKKMLHFTTT